LCAACTSLLPKARMTSTTLLKAAVPLGVLSSPASAASAAAAVRQKQTCGVVEMRQLQHSDGRLLPCCQAVRKTEDSHQLREDMVESLRQ
jgi:hypothetical protein